MSLISLLKQRYSNKTTQINIKELLSTRMYVITKELIDINNLNNNQENGKINILGALDMLKNKNAVLKKDLYLNEDLWVVDDNTINGEFINNKRYILNPHLINRKEIKGLNTELDNIQSNKKKAVLPNLSGGAQLTINGDFCAMLNTLKSNIIMNGGASDNFTIHELLNNGKINQGGGIASAFASLITLGSGGSSGREGPVVHLAAVISGWVCNKVQIDTVSNRDLLGCAVAAAVSASFNAPIAGALFALEVVLRHFAIHAFAPIVIASVIGTVINRLTFGNVTEFILPSANNLGFYVELPAFILLGLCCGLIAVILMRALFLADDIGNSIQRFTGTKRWLRPAIAGTLLGGIAIWFPHIIGVGYETISAALTGEILLHEAIIFAIMKVIAVSITIGGRMGGGIFSPSLMIGSLTGLAFGWIATSVFPTLSGEQTIYALAGMGAVSAAVLGAPISTTLIVFELTGDWQTGLAVMVAVSFSIVISSKLVHQSYFLTQIERRGIHLAAGPQAYILSTLRVSDLMTSVSNFQKLNIQSVEKVIEAGIYLSPDDTLEDAMPIFENADTSFIPIVEVHPSKDSPSLLGVLYQTDALKKYNVELVSRVKEEHS